jgi:hypothetical protein
MARNRLKQLARPMTISVSEMRSLLDALVRARMSGVLITRHGDKMIQYKSDEDMAKAIADIKADINAATGRKNVGFASFSRGDC